MRTEKFVAKRRILRSTRAEEQPPLPGESDSQELATRKKDDVDRGDRKRWLPREAREHPILTPPAATRLAAGCGQIQAARQQPQLLRAHPRPAIRVIGCRPPEAVPLEPLRRQPQPRAIPRQNRQTRVRPVTNTCPPERIHLEPLAHQGVQLVEALAQVLARRDRSVAPAASYMGVAARQINIAQRPTIRPSNCHRVSPWNPRAGRMR